MKMVRWGMCNYYTKWAYLNEEILNPFIDSYFCYMVRKLHAKKLFGDGLT